MMNEKELLEKAAHAAGIEGVFRRFHQAYGDDWVEGIDYGGRFFWNPLAGDGDALRLAVKLGLSITAPHPFSSLNDSEMIVTVSWYDEKEKWVSEIFESSDELEPMRRTRLAITRAAVQQGVLKLYE